MDWLEDSLEGLVGRQLKAVNDEPVAGDTNERRITTIRRVNCFEITVR